MGDEGRMARLGRAASRVSLGCAALYAAVVCIRPGIAAGPLTDVPYCAALLAAVLAAASRAVTASTDRLAWRAIALALAAWTSGQLWWVTHRTETPTFPSGADAGWVAFYFPAYVGCVLLLAGQVRRLPLSVWLDGLMGGLVAGAVGALALPTIVAGTGGEPLQVAGALVYPLGDLLLLCLVTFAVVLGGQRPSRPVLLLGAGLVVFALSDSGYLYRTATETYVENTILDVGWPLGIALMGCAAVARRHAAPAALRPTATTFVPVGGALLAIALLAYATGHAVGLVAVVLATAAAVSAVGRLLVTLGEVRRLAESRQLALTDHLTGLGNRRSVYAETDARLKAGDARAALLLLDLDRFKELNDTLGHHAGDELLRQVADRLRTALPGARVIARLGGDEFVALLDAADAASALAGAAALREALEEPFVLEDMATHVSGSIGIALAPDHGRTRTELLRHADVAMYRAKRTGTDAELYCAEGDSNSRDRLQLANDLRRALREDELVLHYQPKADLATGRVVGVEALARWQHPERGLLYPDAFIGLAEQHGLMRGLTLRVLDVAAAQQRTWRDAGTDLSVAVNLSAANLLDVRLPVDVAAILERHGTHAGGLQLEITEDTIMADPARALEVLARLSELGLGLSLDDFGTGYSSLAHLKRLPVAELKIDRSFVMGMTNDPDDAVIVRSTVELARSLGRRVVAEGVETPAHWRALADMGCDVAQGYHLSRPLPADALAAWLRERAPAPAVGTAGAVRARPAASSRRA